MVGALMTKTNKLNQKRSDTKNSIPSLSKIPTVTKIWFCLLEHRDCDYLDVLYNMLWVHATGLGIKQSLTGRGTHNIP